MEEFDYRQGTRKNEGFQYEDQMIAYLAVAARNQKNLKDFWIVSNADEVGAWDDIILYTETVDGEKSLQFIQLKHKDKPDNKIWINSKKFKNDYENKYIPHLHKISSMMSNEKEQQKIKELLTKTGVPFENIEFIIMTNAGVEETNSKAVESPEKKPVALNDYKLEPETKQSFIMTNAEGSVYKMFSNNLRKQPYQNKFTKQFFIISEQSGVHNDSLLNNIIEQLHIYIIHKNFQHYSDAANILPTRLTNWLQKNKRALRYADIDEILSSTILFTYKRTKPISRRCSELNDKEWKIFIKLTENYQLVVFSEKNLVFKNYFKEDATHYFINCEKNDIAFIIDCLKRSRDTKIILLVSHESFNPNIETQVSTLNLMNTLPKELLMLLNDCTIMIQGRETNFERLMTQHPKVVDFLNVDDVLTLLSGPLRIAEVDAFSSYYIPRSIPRIFLNKSIIFERRDSYFIIIVENNLEDTRAEVNFYFNSKAKLKDNNKVILENFNVVDQDTFNEEISKVTDKNIHVLKYHKYNTTFVLEWIYSNSIVNELYNFIETGQFNVQPIRNNAAELYLNSNINRIVIAADPGMGKTYFIKHLANNYPVDWWVISIILNDVTFESVDNFQKYLDEYTKKLKRKDNQMFTLYLEKSCVVVLFDGFDEIAPDNVANALNLINGAAEKGLKIVVTSREVTKSILEKKLNVLARALNPFTKDDKREYLRNYYSQCMDKPEKVEIFASKLLEPCSISWVDEFTGIPLHCHMIAEVFRDEFRYFCETNEMRNIDISSNLIKLYEKFIDNKFKIYIEEKVKLQAAEPFKMEIKTMLRKKFFRRHLKAALQVIFPEIRIKISDNFAEKIKSGDEKHGIIIGIDEKGNPEFIHRTFAEYFAAKYLIDVKDKKVKLDELKQEEYLKFLVESQYHIVRDLFDMILCKTCDLHNAVLNADVKKVEEILEKNGGRDEGKCGRNAFHLIAARGAPYVRENGTIKRKGEEQYSEILNILLKKIVCSDEEDEVLRWTPLEYAVYRNAFGIIDKILQRDRNQKYDWKGAFKNKWENGEVLQLCARYDYLNIAQSFVDLKSLDLRRMKFVWEGWYEEGSLLHVAAYNGSEKLIDALLQYVEVSNVDKDGRTGLHFACYKGHLSAVKTLLKNGAQLLLKDNHGYTPMDLAFFNKSKELLDFLTAYDVLKTGFINHSMTGLHGRTALHYAALANNWTSLGSLISNGANVNITDDDGETALHKAFFNGHLASGKVLVKGGAHLFIRDRTRRTPIDLVVVSDNRELVEYATSYDVLKTAFGTQIDTELSTYHGHTALYYAAQVNNLSTIEKLLSEGANVNITDKEGRTPLHIVCLKGYLEAVKILLEKGAKLFLQDKDEWTPMDKAIENGNAELVEYLTGYDILKIGFGDNINAELSGKYKGRTALYVAALGNNLLTVKRLQLEKAKVSITDEKGNTPFHTMCKNKGVNKDIMQFLVQHGMNINEQNVDGKTALHVAVEGKENKDLVMFLLELEANPNIVDNKQQTALCVARQRRNDDIFTFLFERTQRKCERDNVYKSVITDLDKEDVRRKTFFDFPKDLSGLVDSMAETGFYYLGVDDKVTCYACDLELHHWQPSHDPCLRHVIWGSNCTFLVQKAGKKFIQSHAQDENKRTALHYKCQEGNLTDAKTLVERGGYLFSPDKNGWTPMDEALKSDSRELIEYVTSYDALKTGFCNDIRFWNAALPGRNQGCTAVHYAAQGKNLSCLQRLIQEGADVNITDTQGWTALHWSCHGSGFDKTIVDDLVKADMNINVQDRWGQTALYWAALKGNKDAVQLLLNKGANPNIENKNKQTALTVAREELHNEIFLIIFEKYVGAKSEPDEMYKSALTRGAI